MKQLRLTPMIITPRPARIKPLEYLATLIIERKTIPAIRMMNPSTRSSIFSSDLECKSTWFWFGGNEEQWRCLREPQATPSGASDNVGFGSLRQRWLREP